MTGMGPGAAVVVAVGAAVGVAIGNGIAETVAAVGVAPDRGVAVALGAGVATGAGADVGVGVGMGACVALSVGKGVGTTTVGTIAGGVIAGAGSGTWPSAATDAAARVVIAAIFTMRQCSIMDASRSRAFDRATPLPYIAAIADPETWSAVAQRTGRMGIGDLLDAASRRISMRAAFRRPAASRSGGSRARNYG